MINVYFCSFRIVWWNTCLTYCFYFSYLLYLRVDQWNPDQKIFSSFSFSYYLSACCYCLYSCPVATSEIIHFHFSIIVQKIETIQMVFCWWFVLSCYRIIMKKKILKKWKKIVYLGKTTCWKNASEEVKWLNVMKGMMCSFYPSIMQ